MKNKEFLIFAGHCDKLNAQLCQEIISSRLEQLLNVSKALVNTLDCKMCIVLDKRMCIQYVVANYNSYFFRTISGTQSVYLDLSAGNQLRCVMRKPDLWRHKGHVSFAVTAQLISAFVYATQIAQSLLHVHISKMSRY